MVLFTYFLIYIFISIKSNKFQQNDFLIYIDFDFLITSVIIPILSQLYLLQQALKYLITHINSI